MKHFAKKALHKLRRLSGAAYRVELNSMLLARLLVREHLERTNLQSLSEVEFRVFSQWGEDGIIQYLINTVPITDKSFIEFGVQYYTESNTRFLLLNDNWRGLVIDGGRKYIDYIRHDEEVYRRHNLTAVCHFITRDNINSILRDAGFEGDIGLMSIDIDGNDYWVWEAIEVVRPRIVICEYNSVFGPDVPVSVPYHPSFERRKAHYSDLYFGASLPALCLLAARKGYDFVGSNSAGVNAFFVRSDIPHGLRKLSSKDGYVVSQQRESRDVRGELSFVSGLERLDLIKDEQVINVETHALLPLRAVKEARATI